MNTFMENKNITNKEAIRKYITPMNEESCQKINEFVNDIERGKITKHFTTEILKHARKKY
ncbi:hypothetical protein EVI01_18950 [Enterococcus villorum]|uniref:Uncharacterized protein n=1 Tax=Enterococcus villorum TaxID=112904 RepID=A0A511J3G6_9ENTE|nr:hypothetical protein EVI01_18950 [Enterococcus villorum]